MSVFSKNFTKYRLAQGFTQCELAIQLCKTQGAIGHYEKGRREPRPSEIRAWERILPDFCRFDIMPEVFGKTPDEGLKVWNRVHGQ